VEVGSDVQLEGLAVERPVAARVVNCISLSSFDTIWLLGLALDRPGNVLGDRDASRGLGAIAKKHTKLTLDALHMRVSMSGEGILCQLTYPWERRCARFELKTEYFSTAFVKTSVSCSVEDIGSCLDCKQHEGKYPTVAFLYKVRTREVLFLLWKGQMLDLDLESLKKRMIEALAAMGYETDVFDKSAAADTFRECLRLAHERGRHVLITNTPTGIGVEFLQ